MNLSIIIPTRNRAKILSKALDSIIKQTISQKEFEVLIIDNGSKDNTKEIVDNYKGKIKNIRYFYDDTPGLHAGRHRGLKEALNNILVYADDDIEAFPTWLEGIQESFLDSNIVLVGGKNLPNYEDEVPQWILNIWNKYNDIKIIAYLSVLDLGDKIKEISPYHIFGCNFSIRKNIIIEAGGFHPDGMPQELIKYRGDGETYISKYIEEKNLKTLYNPKASVYHLVSKDRLSLAYFKKRAFNQGISDSYTYIRNNRDFISKKSLFRLSIRNIICSTFILFKLKNTIDIEIEKAYNLGFKFHQLEVKKDKKLLEWVLKDTYLEI